MVEEVEEVKVQVKTKEVEEVEVEEAKPQFQPVAEVRVPHYTAAHNRYILIGICRSDICSCWISNEIWKIKF